VIIDQQNFHAAGNERRSRSSRRRHNETSLQKALRFGSRLALANGMYPAFHPWEFGTSLAAREAVYFNCHKQGYSITSFVRGRAVDSKRAGFLLADYAALHCARLRGVTAQLITVMPWASATS
jgi:hypothetical protein